MAVDDVAGDDVAGGGIAGREATTGAAGVMSGGAAGALGGGAAAAVTGISVGWVIGFLIGLLTGMAIGESRGIYRGMQGRPSSAPAEALGAGGRGLGLLGAALTGAGVLALLFSRPWRSSTPRGRGMLARVSRPGRSMQVPFVRG